MPVKIDQEAAREFQQRVMDWWSKNVRALPWRQDSSPYSVLVSEIMFKLERYAEINASKGDDA